MTTLRRLLVLLVLTTLPAFAELNPAWTTPTAPFRIADNLYYVGSRDLAAYLVITADGSILINANLESSPPQIRAAVEKLGFRWSSIRILLDGQAHYDHMAGAAQVLRETHAKNMVMAQDAELIRSGGRAGFAASTDGLLPFPPARIDRILHDGDTVTLGGVTLTAHLTPGHTPGCTTWTFQTHVPGEPAAQRRNVVIVGGTTVLAQYSLTGFATSEHPASYPHIAEDFQHTFHVLRSLPCDIFLGAHGAYFGMLAKLDRYPAQGPAVFIDPAGYKAFIDRSEQAFEAALHKQQRDEAGSGPVTR